MAEGVATPDPSGVHSAVADILLLQQGLRKTPKMTELGYLLVNETHRLVDYRTAVFWREGPGDGRVEAISGIPRPERNAPFTLWVSELCRELMQRGLHEPGRIDRNALNDRSTRHWADFLPAHALWLPLIAPTGVAKGGLLLARDKPWQEGELGLLKIWSDSAAHAIETLQLRRRDWLDVLHSYRAKLVMAIVFVLFLLMWLPVSLSVLAPAEVVAKDPHVIRAPLDGVIGEVLVKPNQQVSKGDLLLELDDTSLLSRQDVARQDLEIARAEYRRAEQGAVTDRQASSEIPMLKARMEQKESELEYVQSLLARIRLYAAFDGIVILPDSSELAGMPVRIGEKLMMLAKPGSAELEFWLPVGDSVPLPDAADVDLFLNVRPDRAVALRLQYVNYQAEVTAENTLAFRGRADFLGDETLPRIGLHGTARLYGEKVPLYYFLFRRPFSALRQWLGW